MLENHPFGSQAFIPLQKTEFIVVVSAISNKPDINLKEAFFIPHDNVINFKDLQIYSSDSLDKYIVVDKETQTIRFLENLRSIEEHGKLGLEEERRLAYVALTRARKKIHITYCIKFHSIIASYFSNSYLWFYNIHTSIA